MSSRHVDVLIVGAGIAGLLLARELMDLGTSVALVHDPAHAGASEAAVGLLNPVRGPRCTLAWQATETFRVAREVYTRLAADGEPALGRALPVVRLFADTEQRAAFLRKAAEIEAAGFRCREMTAAPGGVRPSACGAVAIEGGGVVDARRTIASLRSRMRTDGVLVEAPWTDPLLEFRGSRIHFPATGLIAGRVVLAAGIGHAHHPSLPPAPALRPVRGEALLIHAPELDNEHALVSAHHLAPLTNGIWACGGTKVPGDAQPRCTAEGRAELEEFLRTHLGTPWRVMEHWSGVRPATIDTKPLVGRAPGWENVYFFNGLGSQGFALGPWLARALARHLAAGGSLPKDVDPARFVPRTPVGGAERWRAVDVAHAIVERHLAPGDLAIDLTSGQGGDAAWLADQVGADGAVLAIDIQPEAIESTRHRLARAGCETPVILHCADHAKVRMLVPAAWHGRVGAVVANLGYLPGSHSPVVTRPDTTIEAIAESLPLLRAGGVLVVVIYTQHPGGAAELAAIERWARQVDASRFHIAWHRAPDGNARAPVILAASRHGCADDQSSAGAHARSGCGRHQYA